jgi:hypothetical protein
MTPLQSTSKGELNYNAKGKIIPEFGEVQRAETSFFLPLPGSVGSRENIADEKGTEGGMSEVSQDFFELFRCRTIPKNDLGFLF